MIDLSNVMSPIETANGLPNACYVDDAMFTHERDTLFRDSWAAIGFGKDILRPGMVKPVDFLGTPLLMVRNAEGKINVFENVCLITRRQAKKTMPPMAFSPPSVLHTLDIQSTLSYQYQALSHRHVHGVLLSLLPAYFV